MPLNLTDEEKKRRAPFNKKMAREQVDKDRQAQWIQTEEAPAAPTVKPPSAPESSKWYQGTAPTAREYLAQVYTISQRNPQLGQELYGAYDNFRSDPTNPLYQPYSKPTNGVAFAELSKLGIDTTNVNSDWFKQNAGLKQYLQVGIDGTPVKGKTKESKAAYYAYKVEIDEENTQKVEQAWDAAQRDIAYWTGRTDLNLSDEEILAKVDIPKNYKILTQLDESRASGSLFELNRPVAYSEDAMLGSIWAARNGQSTGDPMLDAAMSSMKSGKQYQDDPAKRSARDPASKTYNPYLLGSTLDEEAAYFGVPAFDKAWLDENLPKVMAGTDDDAKQLIQNVYIAEENTRKVEDAAATFSKANIDSWASFGARQGMDAKAVLAAYFTEDFAPLGKLSESLERRQPLGLTRAVDFDYHGALAKLDKAIADKKLPIAEQAEQRKKDVIAKDGDATQPETVPETSIDKSNKLPGYAQWFKNFVTSIVGPTEPETAPAAEEPPAKSQIPGMKGTMAAAGATDVPLKDGFASSTVDEKRKELDALEAEVKAGPAFSIWTMDIKEQQAYNTRQDRISALRDEIRVGERKESQTALMTLAIPEKYTPKGKSEVARAREYAKTTKAPLDQVSQNFKEQIPAIVIEQALLMNEDDARRYEYIYETKDRDAAELFLEGIGAKYLNADVAKAEQESATKYGKDMPILSTIGSVAGGALAKPIEAIQVYWDRMIVGKDLVENDPRLSTTRRVGTIRESVSEDFSDFGKFVYNTGLSIAENLGTRMLGPASLLAMGLGGAASTMESVMARDGSSEQAYALGTVSLLVETITEKLQFDRFTAGMKPGIGGSLKSNVYNYLVGGIKSALPEAGEELVSGAATTVAELMLLGKKSTVWLTYEDAKAGYLKNNMPPEEADNLAWIDACKATGADILLGAAAGGLSGLAFGDIAVFVNQCNGILAKKAATQTGTQLAAETDPDTQTALALQLTVQAMNANGDVSALETQAAATLGIDLKTVQGIGKLAGGKPVGFVGALRILADPKTKRDRIIASALKASGADVAALTRINLIANTLSPETQNPKVDEALSTALKASVQTAAGTDIDLEFTLQRWGQKGLLYLDTLLKSGLEGAREAAVALQSLPSYAQAVVVAERNLQRMTVSPEDIQLQLQAYNWDLGTPELVDNAVERATEQAVESLTDAALAAMQDPVTEAEQLQGIQTAERNVAITANDVAMARQGVDGAWAAAEEADAAFSQTPGDQRLLSQAEAALTEATKAEADLARAQDSARAATELHEKLTTDYDLKKTQQRQEAEAQARDQVAKQREAAKPAANAEAAYRAALEGMNNGTGSMEEVNTTLAAWNEARGIKTEQAPAEQAPLQDLDTEADIYLEKMMPDASEEDRAEARAMFKEKMEARLGKPQAQEPLFGEKSVKFAQKASKKFGITFISDPDVKGVEEAYWDPTDNSIHLNPNATRGDALVGIAMHELTHAAETSGWYTKLSGTVLGILYNGDEAAQERDITAKIDRYKRAGKTLTVEGALQEIVAQGIRNKVFDSEESINRFLDMDVTLGQKILEVFNRVIATFKGDGEADILKARSLLEKALKDRQPNDGRQYSLADGPMTFKVTGQPASQQILDAMDKASRGELLTVEEVESLSEVQYIKSKREEFFGGRTPALLDDSRKQKQRDAKDYIDNMGSAVRDENGVVSYTGKVIQGKEIHLVTGITAAGKSGELADPLSNLIGGQLIDSDFVMTLFEEHNQGEIESIGDDYLHPESKAIALGALDTAIHKGNNIVHPVLGQTAEKVQRLIDRVHAIDPDYRIFLDLNELPMAKGIGRMLFRTVDKGRYIDVNLMYEAGDGPSAVFDQMKDATDEKTGRKLFDGYSKQSNDVEFGQRAVHIEGIQYDFSAWFGRPGSGLRSSSGNTQSPETGRGDRSLSGDGRGNAAGEGEALQEVSQPDTQYSQAENTSGILPSQESVRKYSFSDDNSADMDAYIESLIGRYGALPQGETPVDTTPLPARTEDGKKVRRFAGNVSESGALKPEQREAFNANLVDGAYSYDPISDAVALDAADKLALRGGADAMQQAWTQALTDNKTPGKMAVAVGERLLQEYANTNDTEGAMRMTAELAEVMTHAGQTVQAARLLKKMTGAGRLYYLQRSVNRVNRNNKTNIELNPDLVTDLLNAKDEAGRNAAVEALSKDAGQQLPPNWKSRLDAWRYFAMLGNPRTHIRNLVGNAVFMPAVKIKNMIGAGLEFAKGAERTKSLVLNRSLLKAARADAEANLGMLTSGGKYNPTDDIEQYRPSFGRSVAGRALEGVTQMNMRALEAEDAIFLKRHYANALAGYLQANKLTIETADKKTLDKARQYAVEEAKKATYRDASTLATTLNQISKKGGIAGLVIEGVLPFKKTPMNVLKRGIEYSPIGLLDGFTRGLKQYKSGKITQTQLIDKISAGMTGTMIAVLGGFLASTGALKVGFKDDKEDEFKRLTGSQEYAIEIFGQSITLDWMTPASMPLFVGATMFNMAEQGIDPENAFKEVTGALSEIMEPVFNLTMLDGVSSAIEAASWSQEDPITAMFVNSMTNYAGQYVPTLLGQVARTIDPIRRKAYTDKNSPLPNAVQQMLGKAANKIPGLASKSEPYLDIWGKEEVSKSPVMRAFENFLSPAYINELTPDAVETMLSEVYKLTQDPSVLPATASKYFTVNGERIDLNGPQYTQFTKTRGETMYTTMDSLLKNETFQGLEPRLKAATLAKVITYANEVGKAALSDFELGTTMSTIAKSSDPGQAVIDQVLQKEQGDAQSSYKIAALDSVSTGDAESLSATYGALDQWYRAKYPDYTDKKINGAIAEYLNAGSNIKKMYIAAYDEGDDDLMAQIEETLASVGIKYNYTSWMMKP